MKFQSFLNFTNFTKKIIEIIKMFLHFWFFTCCPHPFYFWTSLFIKRCYVSVHSYSHYVISFKHVNFGKHVWIHTSKNFLKKIMLILKFHPEMKCLHVFFFFFSSRDEISSLSFWQGWVHPGMKFHLGKNV